MATNESKLPSTIHAWQERLLQLDRRNSLLYFKGGGTTVPVVPDSADALDNRLQSARSGLTFPFAERVGRARTPNSPGQDSQLTERIQTKPGALSSSVDPIELQRRLRAMSKRAREWEDEQGLNVLFLACGFLNWVDQDGESARAPLLLLPCQLRQTSPRDPFVLSRESDEVLANVTLQFVLHRMGIDLPDFDQDTMAEYFAAVAKRFRTRNWSVTEEVYLATFSYAKLAMWEDLEQLRSEGTEHEIIRHLAGVGDYAQVEQHELSALPPDLSGGMLDDFEAPEDEFAVLPADFSQRLAIRAARAGRNLVVHGPPGTGKSQTIANIIATLLADGKKVLFVSEKTAALDVVKRRLADCGLEDFCLDLHSERAQKSAVYEQLRTSLRANPMVGTPDFDYDALRRRRGALNQYSRALHQPRSLGTLFQVHGLYAHVASAPQVEWGSIAADAVTKELLEHVEAAAARIARRPSEFRDHDTSVWRALRSTAPSVLIADQIRSTLRTLQAAINAAQSELRPIAAWLDVPIPYGLDDAEDLEQLALQLAGAPQAVLASWLSEGRLTLLMEIADLQQRQQVERLRIQRELVNWFGSGSPSISWGQTRDLSNLTTDERSHLAECIGPDWESELLQSPHSIGECLDALRIGATELAESADGVAPFLGTAAVTVENIHAKARLLDRVVQIGVVPNTWFHDSGIPNARSGLAKARDDHETLAEAEAAIFVNFDEHLIDSVDEALVGRFRTDYSHGYQRVFGAYRRDIRILKSHLRSSLRLDYRTARDVLERCADIKMRRSKWQASETLNSTLLGSAFRGRETDWERLGHQIDQVETMLADWPAGRPSLEQILTQEQAQSALKGSLSTLRASIEKISTAFSRIKTSRLTEASPLAGISEHTEQALTVIARLTIPLEAILAQAIRPIASFSELRTLCDTALRLEAIEAEDAALAPRLASDFGTLFQGATTDWDGIQSRLIWVRKLLDLVPRPSTGLTNRCVDPPDSVECQRLAGATREAIRRFEDALRALDASFDPGPSGTPWIDQPFDELRRWADELSVRADEANGWVEYRAATADLEQAVGNGAVSAIRRAVDDSSIVPAILRRKLLGIWLDHEYSSDPALRTFTGHDHNILREEFVQLDRRLPLAARAEVRRRCFSEYPSRQITPVRSGQLGTLQGELTKRRRQLPVRKLLDRTGTIVQALKPCFMMSPLAVSQFLPRSGVQAALLAFDTVIFDEASQVYPEDAIPAISRGRQLIVVGDQQQLPPTSFFQRQAEDDGVTAYDDDDNDDGLRDRESILDAMVALVGHRIDQAHLDVHYRSRHEDLIRFSNHQFYDDRLLVFPSPDLSDSVTGWSGVRSEYLLDGKYRPGGKAGGDQTNPVEAQRAADDVFELIRTIPDNESVGVVALSRAQADLIERLIDERRLQNPDIEYRFGSGRHEPFFVKNLETVQGDERDHIILSIGYGPSEGSGGVFQRFGPLAADGGHRRLNVAVTRARRSLTVIHSMQPGQIVATTPGARLLRRFIEYVRDPKAEVDIGATVGGEAESPFELAVGTALEAQGHRIHRQVGAVGYRIDLAVLSEDGLRYDLAVECDGATYHRSPTARDRDWLRQQVLEGLGWRVHRVWSTAWVRNPVSELRAIETALELARANPAGPERPALPFEDSAVPLRAATEPTLSVPMFQDDLWADLSTIRVGPELQNETTANLVKLITATVDIEGPVHVDQLSERIRDRYGLRRIGPIIQGRIDHALRESERRGLIEKLKGEPSFVNKPGRSTPPRAAAPGYVPRAIERISLAELIAGLVVVATQLYGATGDDLVRETARGFGYLRVGDNIHQRLGLALRRAVREGHLLASGDLIIPTFDHRAD